jgi:hypothetical protein
VMQGAAREHIQVRELLANRGCERANLRSSGGAMVSFWNLTRSHIWLYTTCQMKGGQEPTNTNTNTDTTPRIHAHRLGALPLINHYLERLQLTERLQRFIPTHDPRIKTPIALTLTVLLLSAHGTRTDLPPRGDHRRPPPERHGPQGIASGSVER